MFEEHNASPPDVVDSYSFRLAELNGMIGGSQELTELNGFAEKLSEMSEYERALFVGAAEITGCYYIAECDLMLNNLDCFELTPNVGDYETLGRQVAAVQFTNLPPDVLEHLDYERLGKTTHEDDMSAFVHGHRVVQIEPQFDLSTPSADPLQGYTLKTRLVSEVNPDGVWIKFPLYESEPSEDVERGEEIQVALAALKADALNDCRVVECVCEYPSLNRCHETHAVVPTDALVWKARNFAYAESELSQYGKGAHNKLAAALELEDCADLDFAANITQNLRCYNFGRDPEAIAEEYLMMCNVNPILTSCFDRKSLGEKLVADRGMVQTANGLIAHNGNEFVYDYYESAPQSEPAPQTIRLMCPLEVKTDPDSELGREYCVCENKFGYATIPNDVAAEYEANILAALEKEHMPEEKDRGLAGYLCDEALQSQISYIWPTVKIWNGELWGVMEIRTIAELSSREMAELTDWCVGQLSDGLGESVEQHPISTRQGDLYVSFWHSGDDYFLKPEQEVIGAEQTFSKPEPEQNIGLSMGGM
jgi:hypothetical protein